MDPNKQPTLLTVVTSQYAERYGSSEATKGHTLTTALEQLSLEERQTGKWFDTSVQDQRKIAARISNRTGRSFMIEIGVTTPDGSMDEDDMNLLVLNWASIEADLTPHSLRYPEIHSLSATCTLGTEDWPEDEVSWDSPLWDEIQYTIDRAIAAYGND